MAVVYNYFEPIPILDPENPKFESRICKTCSKTKRIEKGKTSIVQDEEDYAPSSFQTFSFLNKMKIFSRTDIFLLTVYKSNCYFFVIKI